MVALMCGCIDDTGNYDYKELRKLEVTNYPYRVVLSPGESHTYAPRLMTKDSTLIETAEYEWLVNNEVVSNQKAFTFTATKVGEFEILVRIIDPLTNASYLSETSVTVKSIYESGFLILSENGGNSELSMIRAKRILGDRKLGTKDTMIYDGEYANIYQTVMDGEKIAGKPYRIREHWANDDYNSVMGEITVMSEENGKYRAIELNGETMKRETYIEQEFQFNVLPSPFNPKEIIHTVWDSFILNEDEYIYPRRSAQGTAYHTGYFSADVKYLNGRKYSDLLFTYYPTLDAILALEYDSEGKRNYVGIQISYYSDRKNLIRLPFVLSDENAAYFTDIQGKLLFSDYRFSGDADGAMSVILYRDGAYYLHHFGANVFTNQSLEIVENQLLNLTQLQGINQLIGMCTTKKYNYTYYCDEHTLYFCEGEYNDYGTVTSFPDRKIVSLAEQSNSSQSSNIRAHLAIAFDDGSLEIYELNPEDPSKLGKKVFTTTMKLEKIKQIIFKLGLDGRFFYM